MPDHSLAVSFYESHLDNAPTGADAPWPELAAALTTFAEPLCSVAGAASSLPPCAGRECRAKYGLAWSPAKMEGPRANANVRSVSAAVFDLDHVDPAALDALLAAVDGYAFALHSTHSHAVNDPCYRLVLPLDRPATPQEYPTLRRAVIDALGVPADPQTKDLSRLYFLPSHRAGVEPVSRVGEGEFLSVDDALAAAKAMGAGKTTASVAEPAPEPVDLSALRARLSDARRSKASSAEPRLKEQAAILGRILDGEPLAQLGERDGTMLRACGLLAHWLPATTPWAAVLEILRPSLSAMPRDPSKNPPETFEYLAGVAEEKFRRQVAARVAADERAAVDTAALREIVRGASDRAAPRAEDVPGAAEDPEAWRRLVIEAKSGPRACEYNARLILACAPETRGTVCWNEFSKQIEVRGGALAGVRPATLDVAAAGWLQRNYELFVGARMTGAALFQLACENPRDPISEYLGELAWDGAARLDGFMERYLGAYSEGRERYVRAVSRRWLISLVARALAPGCKVDTVLVLEGDQGKKKSTALEALVGGPYYLDTALKLGDKDAMQAIAGAWLVELGELASFHRAETERVRQFLSLKVDKYRPPYGRVTEESPRRCVFVGTTNNFEDYLTDRAGNRRYWPIRVAGEIDVEALKRDRDQILAEAVAAYRAGERWWFEGDEQGMAAEETEERLDHSTTEEMVERWWYSLAPDKRPRRVSMLDVLEQALKVSQERLAERGVRTGVGTAMRALGFKRTGRVGTERARYYEPTGSMLAEKVRATPGRASYLSLVERTKGPQNPKGTT